ncbi:MAG: CHASE2 domain-containing protein [Candidatus Omnitrophica bacterium]|nr:CHASE2 domain-containing protein [Candidatus Omnitrophota bacterium]
MGQKSEYLKTLLIGVLTLIAAYLFSSVYTLKICRGINDFPSWYIYSLSSKVGKEFKFVGVAVDDYSLNSVQHRWPWRRSTYARVLETLSREGVDTVGIDLAFIGESENPQDDILLGKALNESASAIVVGYYLGSDTGEAVLPLDLVRESPAILGMLNTPEDDDGELRRLRGYIDAGDQRHYSFSVQMSAAFLKQDPERIISSIPLRDDHTFNINFLLKHKDILEVSFYDLLTNLDKLKQLHGENFLSGSLVMVYPEARILDDIYETPVGQMPGGIIHLNGIANIASQHFLRDNIIWLIVFSLISFILIFYILSNFGFISGAVFTTGVLIFNFWGAILLSLGGMRYNYSFPVLFNTSFFFFGSLFKYSFFLAQIIKIKNKATLDPLRNLFTLRYFYYRLGLEARNIYFRKDIFLVLVYLESFQDALSEMPSVQIKSFWQKISTIISSSGRFWSVYSQEKVAGCVVGYRRNIDQEMNYLKAKLQDALSAKGIRVEVKIAYTKFKRSYPLRDALSFLSECAEDQDAPVRQINEDDLEDSFKYSHTEKIKAGHFLDSFDQDIEDRNRELLSLIDRLNKEHSKTREAFFQIITSLVNALEAKDKYTQGHSDRVSGYALMIAEKLGWSVEQKENLKKAALLHDLGKIGIPDTILHKKGSLNEEEYRAIKKHGIISVKILKPLREMEEVLPWILHHHERWDGKGYPDALSGEAIPEAAQIIALADVFDALTTGRDYKKAFSVQKAIEEIKNNMGTQFSPTIAVVFLKIISDQSFKKLS